MGAQHRGAWKRNAANAAQTQDPEAEVDTRGAPLSAMRLPPSPTVVTKPGDVVLGPDGELDPDNPTDFDFLSFR